MTLRVPPEGPGLAVRTRPKGSCPHCGQPGGICPTHRARLAEIAASLNRGKRREGWGTIAGTRGIGYEATEDDE